MGNKLLGLFLLAIMTVVTGYAFRFQMTQHVLDVSYYNAQQANKMALIKASRIDRETTINEVDQTLCQTLFKQYFKLIGRNGIGFVVNDHVCNANYSQSFLTIDTPSTKGSFDVTHLIQRR